MLYYIILLQYFASVSKNVRIYIAPKSHRRIRAGRSAIRGKRDRLKNAVSIYV